MRDSAERERALGPFEPRNTDLKGHSPTLDLAAGAWSLTLRDHRSFSSLPACHGHPARRRRVYVGPSTRQMVTPKYSGGSRPITALSAK
jgi:hypothetical protein